MLPSLRLFGQIELSTYSLMSILGILLVLGYTAVFAYLTNFNIVDRFGYVLFAFGGALVFSGLLFQLTQLKNILALLPYLFTDFRYVRDRYPVGIVFYGGLFGVFFGMWLYSAVLHKDTRCWLFQTVPAIPLFHAVGRIGCALAGCCYGIVVEEGGIRNEVIGARCLPVQLYESAGDFVIFLILLCVVLVLYRKQKPRFYLPLGIYFILYGVLRFVLEFWRGDEIRGIYGGLSTSQWISLILLPLGLYCLICPTDKNFFNTLMNHEKPPRH